MEQSHFDELFWRRARAFTERIKKDVHEFESYALNRLQNESVIPHARAQGMSRLRYTIMSDGAKISTIRLPRDVAEVHDLWQLFQTNIYNAPDETYCKAVQRTSDRLEAISTHLEIVDLYAQATGSIVVITEGETDIESDSFAFLEGSVKDKQE